MSLMPSVNAVRLWTTWAVAEGRALHSGRLKRRAMAPQRTLAQVCREAGAPRSTPNHSEVSPLVVETSVDAHAECVLRPGFRELADAPGQDVWS